MKVVGSRSWIGGLPVAPATFVWPVCPDDELPMCFMGQFRLADIPSVDGALTLPSQGYLYFFFCPADAGKVIWVPDEADFVEIVPPLPAPKGWKKLFGRKPRPQDFQIYRKVGVGFNPIHTYPQEESDLLTSLKRESEDEEKFSDELSELRFAEVIGDEFSVQLFGYANPAQPREMELECQLAISPPLPQTGLIYRTRTIEEVSKDPNLLRASKDWQLLLSLGEETNTGFHFGSEGEVYYWMRQQDAVAKDFNRVQVVIS